MLISVTAAAGAGRSLGAGAATARPPAAQSAPVRTHRPGPADTALAPPPYQGAPAAAAGIGETRPAVPPPPPAPPHLDRNSAAPQSQRQMNPAINVNETPTPFASLPAGSRLAGSPSSLRKAGGTGGPPGALSFARENRSDLKNMTLCFFLLLGISHY